MKVCVISLTFLYLCFTTINAQKHIVKAGSYYLDSMGNDNNDGSKGNPWKTIQKANAAILKPGDRLLLKAGQVFNGTIKLTENSRGVSGKPIIITSYGNGKAIINAGNTSAISILKTGFITVKKIKLVGSGRKNGNTKDGISLVNCNNILVDDLDISGFRNAGLSIFASSDMRVTRIAAHDNGFAGISVLGEYQAKKSCSNIYIGYCKAINNPGSPVILDNHSGNGIIAGSCSNVTIEYCTATNNGWDMPRTGNGPVGIWCYEADKVIIQHCISYRNKTSVGGDDGGGFDLDGGVTNSIIQYCLSYENQGSGFGIFQYAGAGPWHNNTVRFNISENDGLVSAAHAGIFIWNSSDDSLQFYNCLFYNNTIYNANGYAINFASQSERKNFFYYNNIFVGADSLLKGKRMNDTFLGNNWWSLKNKFNIEGINNLEEWSKKNGQEILENKMTGLNINPAFKNAGGARPITWTVLKLFNAYKIREQSPLRKKGISLPSQYGISARNDFNGNPAPKNGIGACF